MTGAGPEALHAAREVDRRADLIMKAIQSLALAILAAVSVHASGSDGTTRQYLYLWTAAADGVSRISSRYST